MKPEKYKMNELDTALEKYKHKENVTHARIG
jgi:hypothetical protein